MQIQTRAMYYYNENIPNSQMMMSPSSSSSSSPPMLPYIQHRISKLDTLAGIAIKYGAEVADIKKINGLVTDSQMFALKTLDIPLNGKHPPPPPPCFQIATGHDNQDHNSPDNPSCELFESFHSLTKKSSGQKLSPVLSTLQRHYGTKPTMKKSISEIFSMVEYEKRALKCSENGSSRQNSPMSHQANVRHQKSHSLANGTLDDIMERSDIMAVVEARKGYTDKRKGTLMRRNNKSEANLQHIPELLLKQDNSRNGGFSSRSAKGLAQRQKTVSRVALTAYSNQVV